VGKLRKPCKTLRKPAESWQNTAKACKKLAKREMRPTPSAKRAPRSVGSPSTGRPGGQKPAENRAKSAIFTRFWGISPDFRPQKIKFERGPLLTPVCGCRNPPENHCFRQVFGGSASGMGRPGRRQPAAGMPPARTWLASPSPPPVAMSRWWPPGASIFSPFPALRISWISK